MSVIRLIYINEDSVKMESTAQIWDIRGCQFLTDAMIGPYI